MHRLHGTGMHLKHANTRWIFVGNKHGSEISFQYLRRVALALRSPFACHEHVHIYKTVQVQTWTRQGVFLVWCKKQHKVHDLHPTHRGLHLIVRGKTKIIPKRINQSCSNFSYVWVDPPKWSHCNTARISPFHPWLHCSCVNDWLQHPGV